MSYIDTHAHLYLEHFSADIDEVIERSSGVDVSTIILPNIDSKTISPLHKLVDSYPDTCIPLMGLHPTHVKENYQEELEKILVQFNKYSYKGVGEIGIDLYWDKTYLRQQQYVFETQLDLASRMNLPVVIHSRESFDEILEIVRDKRFEGVQGIFHAFTGNGELAEEIIDLGYLIGIGGILTFKNSQLSNEIAAIDLNHLVLETDSPYLAPVPYRGKRNESSYVPIIAEYLAKITNVTPGQVAEITTNNARKLFGI